MKISVETIYRRDYSYPRRCRDRATLSKCHPKGEIEIAACKEPVERVFFARSEGGEERADVWERFIRNGRDIWGLLRQKNCFNDTRKGDESRVHFSFRVSLSFNEIKRSFKYSR